MLDDAKIAEGGRAVESAAKRVTRDEVADRKRELIARAIKRNGAGVDAATDPDAIERYRDFLKTKKGTHGDYEPTIR